MELRILYATGPGDIIKAHKHWKGGNDDPTQMSLTYSGQFEDFCEEMNATAYLISPYPQQCVFEDGRFIFEHRPKRRLGSGTLYHLSELLYGLSLLNTAIRFRSSVAIISSGCTHYFVLSLFRLFSIRVVTVLHNTLWPKGFPPTTFGQRLVLWLDGCFFRFACDAAIGISPECERQISELTDGMSCPVYVMYPQYRKGHFQGMRCALDLDQHPFRIIFAGRAERNKGVFDILEIARRIEYLLPGRVRWDICGTGSDLDQLKRQHDEMRLTSCVTIHGWTAPSDLRALHENSHLSIVPTKGDFAEGMAKSAIEAVLAGRPLLASSVTPAIEVLKSASIEVKANDIEGYVREVATLINDQIRYRKLVDACNDLRERFYDRKSGFAALLRRAITDRELEH